MSLALVFPGQGSQYVGMGDGLSSVPAAQDLLTTADRVLGLSLSTLIASGPETDLTRTDLSQPAILVTSLMAYAALQAAGKAPDFAAAAGLSLGEYTALVVAGALSAEDAIRLVRLRGQAMQDAAERTAGGMVALIGADEAKAAELCSAVAQGEVLVVANLNSPGQVVISGAKAACERAVAKAKELGIRRAIALPVAGAFHSPLMAPAADRLHAALAATTFRTPRVPVFTNVHGGPVTDPAEIPTLLVRQLTQPVRWADSVVAMAAAGHTSFLELGPKKTLSGMIQQTVKDATCRNVDSAADVVALT